MVSESGTIKPQRRWLLETNSKLQISGGVEIPVSILRVVLDVPHMAWNGNYLESRPTRSTVSTMDVRPYNIGKLRKSMPSTSAIHVGGIDSAAALHHLSYSKQTYAGAKLVPSNCGGQHRRIESALYVVSVLNWLQVDVKRRSEMERYVRHEYRWPYSILAACLVNRITKSKSGTVIDCVNTVGPRDCSTLSHTQQVHGRGPRYWRSQ